MIPPIRRYRQVSLCHPPQLWPICRSVRSPDGRRAPLPSEMSPDAAFSPAEAVPTDQYS